MVYMSHFIHKYWNFIILKDEISIEPSKIEHFRNIYYCNTVWMCGWRNGE